MHDILRWQYLFYYCQGTLDHYFCSCNFKVNGEVLFVHAKDGDHGGVSQSVRGGWCTSARLANRLFPSEPPTPLATFYIPPAFYSIESTPHIIWKLILVSTTAGCLWIKSCSQPTLTGRLWIMHNTAGNIEKDDLLLFYHFKSSKPNSFQRKVNPMYFQQN